MNELAGVAGLLSGDNLTFILKGVSISVAARDVRLVPSLTRALGCRLSADGARLRIILVRSQSEDVLRDVDAKGILAVVFTEPTTHRTLQIKGMDGRLEPAVPEDWDCIHFSEQAFAAEIGQLGFDAAFTARLFHADESDVVVISFTPQAVFQQTPGPNAGAQLEPLA